MTEKMTRRRRLHRALDAILDSAGYIGDAWREAVGRIKGHPIMTRCVAQAWDVVLCVPPLLHLGYMTVVRKWRKLRAYIRPAWVTTYCPICRERAVHLSVYHMSDAVARHARLMGHEILPPGFRSWPGIQ